MNLEGYPYETRFPDIEPIRLVCLRAAKTFSTLEKQSNGNCIFRFD